MKTPNMANMDDYLRRLMDLKHGNLPDLVAEAVRFILREQDKLEERLTVLERASEIACIKDELLEKTMIEAAFSQGGAI